MNYNTGYKIVKTISWVGVAISVALLIYGIKSDRNDKLGQN